MAREASRRANRRIAVALMGVVVAMVGAAYAAVPLYQLFCQVTGFGGTTQVAAAAPETVGERVFTIRFNADVDPGLPWAFQPVERSMTVKVGESGLAFFRAVNLTARQTAGTATFNVTPEIAGAYFNKIDCFCFTQQTLAAHQEADMPVSFFVDPAILDDPEASKIEEITLSYTFFKVEMEDKSAAQSDQADGAATRSFEKGQQPG